MILLIDSREQRPLEFSHPWITSIETVALPVGDYAVRFKDGYRPPFYFERKSLGDLFGTMGGGYARFKREILRSQTSKVVLQVVIEVSYTRVLGGYKHSTLKGSSVVQKLYTLEYRYGIKTHFFSNRTEASQHIVQSCLAIGREYVRRKKENK